MADAAVIARAIDYVEANLQEEISVADMASSVSYSLYHFCRMFNEATHQTPYDYMIRRRLSEAARALLQTDSKIIDIAFDFQFSNPETFSRAFKRLFEMQPRRWRARAGSVSPRLVPRLTLAHLKQIAKGPYLNPVLVTKDSSTMVGLQTLLADERTGVDNLWDLLDHELASLRIPDPRNYSGITFNPEGSPNQRGTYLAGVKDPGEDIAGTALVSKAIPPLACARFIHKGRASELQLTLDYVYHTWLPRSGMRLSLPWVIEQFGDDVRHDDGPEAERQVYIPIQT